MAPDGSKAQSAQLLFAASSCASPSLTSRTESFFIVLIRVLSDEFKTRICAAEMAVRYAALSACRKVRMPSVRAEKYICDASG